MSNKSPQELARDRLAKAQGLTSIIGSIAYKDTLGGFLEECRQGVKHELCSAKKVIDLVRLQGRLTMLQDLDDYISNVINSGTQAKDTITKTLLK